MANITYVSGNKALLNKIEPLWQQLNSHHFSCSPYFKDYYRTLTFQDRKRAILQRALGGEVRVDLALNGDAPIAYCVSSIDRALTGEIDSIFVDAKYRGQGIGRTLMEKALAWLSSVGAKKKIVSVGVGNEQAYGFYAKFGFLPRRTMLEQKS
jgi:GNAT superfamily N-acetyltransferase